jgi:hypothetical protein
MLHDFLNTERAAILALCKKKVIAVGGPQSSSPELESGLRCRYAEFLINLLLISFWNCFEPEGEDANDFEFRSNI